MRKFARLITVLTAVGAFAPLAANAADVGTSMYQPGPIITHTHTHTQTQAPRHASRYDNGRTAHALQMQAIQRNA